MAGKLKVKSKKVERTLSFAFSLLPFHLIQFARFHHPCYNRPRS
jgi:hypothetical protein